MSKTDKIKNAYNGAKERYAELGVNTDEVLKQMDKVDISMHCWQAGDDWRSANLLQQTAALLGKHDDAVELAILRDKIKAAYNREYVTPNGRLSSNTQTAYVVALSFGLLPDALEETAATRLAEDGCTR